MVRKGKSKKWTGFQIFMSVIVVIFVVGFLSNIYLSAGTTETTELEKKILNETLKDISCPDDGDTSLVLNIYNPLNETGTESFDAEITFKSATGKRLTGTDGTAGAYTLDCGVPFELIVESADGASGDNAKIIEYYGDLVGVKVTPEGTVTFTPSGSSYALDIGVSQHATVEAKIRNLDTGTNAFDSGDAENVLYEADGTTFTNGDNATAFALTNAGDFIDFDISLRSVQVDTEFGDLGWYVGVKAPVSEYDEPIVSFDGSLTDIKGTGLNEFEIKQFDGYQYVYKVSKSIVRTPEKLGFYIEANSDASTDLEIDLFAIGKVDSTRNPIEILTSSAQDDSASTTVFAIHDITVDIS